MISVEIVKRAREVSELNMFFAKPEFRCAGLGNCWYLIAKHLAVIHGSFLGEVPEPTSSKNMWLTQRGGGVKDGKNCLAEPDILSLQY